MSERAQALEAAFRAGFDAAQRWGCDMESEAYADWASAAPPVGVSPQPDTALKEAATWVLNVVSGVGRAGGEPEPDEGQAAFQALADALSTPDAQVCVWREEGSSARPSCREGTWAPSGFARSMNVCPFCTKRLEVGTAPQGGEQ